MSKPLPANITSYDLLKTAALVLMIVDHLGYYFFPEQVWMRVIGRMSAPIWLFLVGYARSRDISLRLWAGIAFIVLTNFALGLAILPLCILATILVARVLIDPLMNFIRQRPAALYPISFLFIVLTLPTASFFEYGSEVMMIVMLGYMVRNLDSLPLTKSDVSQFTVVAATSHLFFQGLVFFGFSTPYLIVTGLGLFVVMLSLLKFRPIEYPEATAKLPAPVVWLVQLCGRRTLEIYVIHVAIFGCLAMLLGYPGYAPFSFHIFR